MPFFAKLLPFIKKTDVEVEAAAKKITDKATADVAALRKRSAAVKVKSTNAANVAAFEAALADYKARLAAPSATPTGTTGPTGA